MVTVAVPTQEDADRLGAQVPGIDWHVWNLETPPPAPRFDIVIPPYMAPASVLAGLAQAEIGIVQMQSLGFDGVEPAVADSTVIANARGAHEAPTAELALALALASRRELPAFVRQQDAGLWQQPTARTLLGARVMIFGAGGVGNAIARVVSPLAASVVRVARTAREDELGAVIPTTESASLLPETDVVFLAVPGNAETRHLVDAAFLSALPDGALVVNVARGPVVDTDALLAEVRSGRLFAALDVTDPEPLPSDHPLWRERNVLIAPHVGGRTVRMREWVDAALVLQLRAAVAGDGPVNVVRAGA